MKKANQEIRRALLMNDIRHWELARAMGVTEATLCRWLREEVLGERREKMLKVIEKMASERGDDE